MNSAHDLGGQMAFGPVVPEPNEPVFHGDWEKRVLAINVAAGAMGAWTIDEIRHARESLPPAQYLSSTYYEIWLAALDKVLVKHGFLSADELVSGKPATERREPKRVLKGEEVAGVLRRGFPYEREAKAPARFTVGDKVRTIVMHPQHHTRLPRYARGKTGVVERITGCHVFPDTGAQGKPETAQWLYTVVFDGRELWGRDADPTSTVSIEAWESYLEPA
ncbi:MULTISPECIES: nitrile hydratase subunit beta [Bosea]|uniref:nitrile hydratase subunit beta n=1 Tax=Bosea TaxID=85413 RepID=UPI00215000C2|nr:MULTISPECIES: nitrile hydratase subunit beta [Bosea]MCR4522484.1 nitrile hydratase subunit beta [Bosea sp. 47.2.35]MDR6829047.1 nitrile hydratase [Bosea robiniae]MDR6895931.1 nitrile hydratase [Bosea sp. BE109]MDR7139328.1 nitrile hydratase [Bosea sp. BE168]MDR7176026.1 nitrile hydratase [Bosea sp. BE271]